jgi:hypothetical protein
MTFTFISWHMGARATFTELNLYVGTSLPRLEGTREQRSLVLQQQKAFKI